MDLVGALVRDVARAPIGRVHDVLVNSGTLDARWLQVALDVQGGSVLVPAGAASEFAPGELLVPYPAEVIATAVHAEGTALRDADASRLMRHYGFPS